MRSAANRKHRQAAERLGMFDPDGHTAQNRHLGHIFYDVNAIKMLQPRILAFVAAKHAGPYPYAAIW